MGSPKPKGYTCRSFDWENSNVTFDESPHFDDLEQSDTQVLSSPLELFLDLSDYSPRHLFEAREIRAACSEHISDLLHGGECGPGSLAVWMDDRSRSGGPRSYNGPMKVKDWLERLKLKVRKQRFLYPATPDLSDCGIEIWPRRLPRCRDKTNVIMSSSSEILAIS